jgi:glyoxylase-like metal-dependent hydrolase (beta-lactamase superfamily II)
MVLLAIALWAAICRSGPSLAEPLSIEQVRAGLFLIRGGGGNSLVRLSASGLIVVDGKLADSYDALRAKLKRLSDQPVRVVINTAADDDHTGTNAKFLQDGTRILAQTAAAKNLPEYTPTERRGAPSVIVYDQQYSVKLGGVEAQLWHFGHAHSAGDTVVYFPNLKVIALGDLFATSPRPDFAAGGSLVGWGPVLDQVLKLDFDIAVPGTGPLISKAELETFKSKMDALTSRAIALVRQGVRKKELLARLETEDLGWHFDFTAEQLDALYAELARASRL